MTGAHRQLFAKLEMSLKDLPRQLGVKPKAILIVSGHWEGKDFAVTSNVHPPMVYDFGGFPREMYQIRLFGSWLPRTRRACPVADTGGGTCHHLDPQHIDPARIGSWPSRIRKQTSP